MERLTLLGSVPQRRISVTLDGGAKAGVGRSQPAFTRVSVR